MLQKQSWSQGWKNCMTFIVTTCHTCYVQNTKTIQTVCYHKSRSNSIGQDMLALPWALQSRTQKVWAPAVEMLFLRPAGSLPAILIRKCSFVLSLIINCTVIDLHLVTSFKQQKQMLVVQFWTTCNMLWVWFKKVDLKTNKFPQALVWQWFVERLWQREI